MNIFELLDMTPRKDNKVTQLVKHWDEVVDKHKGPEKIWGLQVKKDGVCALTVIRDGMATIFSRTGKKFTNTDNLCQRISSLNLRDGVYMGEMTCERVSLEVLSGMVNPNRTKPLDMPRQSSLTNLEMNFFDLVSIESFIEGASQTPYQVRYQNLAERLSCNIPAISRVRVLEYIVTKSPIIMDKFFNDIVASGEEGIVIIDVGADWEAGHKGWRKMKKVRGVSYDLLCTGWEEGAGKYANKVANLLFKWKGGKTVKAMLGKGWTHAQAEGMFNDIKSGVPMHGWGTPVGKIFAVKALEESSKGVLRLPKVGELRHDKTDPDV